LNQELMMAKASSGGRGCRVFMQLPLVTAVAPSGIGISQARSHAPAAPTRISTVHTGDAIGGKKVVRSLNIGDTSIPDARTMVMLYPIGPIGDTANSIALCHIRIRQCADVHSVRRRAGARLAALPGVGR